MTTPLADRLAGIHAATVLPLAPDFRVDEAALRAHLRAVSHAPGVRGLLVNGHAGENQFIDLAEKRLVMRAARAAAPGSSFLVCGVNCESSLAAAVEAEAMEADGADALLVFPPNGWALTQTPDSVLLHHRTIAAATSLPLLLYAAPVGAGAMAYPPATLALLARERSVVGIKEGSWEVARYEANRRLLLAERPDFVVLGSGDEHLLTSYLIGSAGSQVSLAAVAPEACVALWDAAAAGDWPAARAVHERLYPLAVAIYRDPPAGRSVARLKAALTVLGRISCDAVRPPQTPATREEYQALEAALLALQ
jgi:4-hydroxy-tetrahydrodipicolinate synthase